MGENESLPYPAKFESFYPETKAIAERMVVAASGPDLLTVSLRPHLVFGPRDTQILPRLVERARAGRLIRIGDGTNMVDMTYVEDVARAHLLAADALEAEGAVAGSIYFISQNEPVQLWPWIDGLLGMLNVAPVRRSLPLPVARLAASMLELTYRALRLKGEPLLTRFLANELALSHYYDISRARRDFGYEPLFSMADAVERTVAYFRSEGI
jgi:nucleoside-diphosphate-sugar epimerase